MGRDQPGLGTGIEATAGESRYGYAAGNIALATEGIGSIVMPPAPPAGLTHPGACDNCVGRGFARLSSWLGGRGSQNLAERLLSVPRSIA